MIILKIVLLCLFSSAIFADNPDWKLVKNQDGVQVFHMKKEGFKLKHHKATTTINTNVSSLLAVFRDTQACPSWVYNCISNQLIGKINDSELIFYTIIDSPLFFKNRDMYLRSHFTYHTNNQNIVILLKPHTAGVSPNKENVRITEISMIWTLVPITENETRITYEIYLDPVMPLKKIVNKFILDSVFHTLKNLSLIVKQPRYQNLTQTSMELY